MAERLNAADSKSAKGASPSWVRIPPFPPIFRIQNKQAGSAKLLQEARVPAFVRPYWPLALDENGEVAAAANLRAGANGCANGWLPEAGSLKGYLWQPESQKQPENPNAPNTV